MTKKIGLISLGCSKNRVDSEIMLGILTRDGFEITGNKNDADIIIVNTCGFIEEAKQESINAILEMAECKKNKCERLIVTGCLAERYNKEIVQQIPEVDAVIGTGDYSEISKAIRKTYEGEKPILWGNPIQMECLNLERVLSTPGGYAYIKIAEGCDNCCTYCIIPHLRGKYKSRRIEDIFNEAVSLARKGVREIILIAQDTTEYGKDLYGEGKLVELLRQLSKIDELQWIRMLYAYPDEFTDDLIEEIAVNPKICKYVDIPFQHASDRILKAMGRRGSSADARILIKRIRDAIPEVVLRTSIMVGFPGEGEDDFDELRSFVEECKFDRLGVFAYSREEDTPAARFDAQVGAAVKKKRFNAIMSLQRKISREKNRARINKVYKVIVDGVATRNGRPYFGRSYAEAPEVDGIISFNSLTPFQIGEFAEVRITGAGDYDLMGVVTNESTK